MYCASMNEDPILITRFQNNLSTVFGSKKTLSLEINDNIDLNSLPLTQLDFVSVPWLGNFENFDVKDIPPIKLAQELVSRKITVLLHVPCRNLNLVSARNILRYIRKIGVRNILAVEGESKFVTKKDTAHVDFPHTSDFVRFLKDSFTNTFVIGVTGYPQKHPRSSDMKQELEFLQMKVSQGADFILTQGCLNKRVILDFQKLCEKFSICVPIIVGTFLLRSTEQLGMLRNCHIPMENDLLQFRDEIFQRSITFENFFRKRLREVNEAVRDARLSEFGGLHFFSFNDSEFISEIMDEIDFFFEIHEHHSYS